VVCAICGTVESVLPVQRQGQASGTGAVAGGVLGAVVGNQVGSGNGKTLATILGGVAGGVAGHAVEKNMKKETIYAVRVHMEDGSTRSLDLAIPPAVGTRVTVEGSVMRGADGSVLSGPAPSQPRPQTTLPNPNTTGG
jgi:outer membrane lipoprotein SlyB